MQPWNQKTLVPWEESYDRPRQCIEKQRYHFTNRGLYSQSYCFFSSCVQTWELVHNQGWAQKNWCFRTVIWRRLLRVPWTSRRSSQSILNEIRPEYSLEGLLLKLKLQNLGHVILRADSLEKTLMLGKIEGKKRRWQRMRWLESVTDSMDMNLRRLQETGEDRGAWHATVHGVVKSQTQLNHWTTVTTMIFLFSNFNY